jgi:hypothetical protein
MPWRMLFVWKKTEKTRALPTNKNNEATKPQTARLLIFAYQGRVLREKTTKKVKKNKRKSAKTK